MPVTKPATTAQTRKKAFEKKITVPTGSRDVTFFSTAVFDL